MNRRGFVSLWIMLALAGLLSVVGLLVSMAVHSVRAGAAMENGLRAQYAAESGAVWGLERIKVHGLQKWDGEFSLSDASSCKVQIRETGEAAGVVHARGTSPAGAVRYIQLHVEIAGDEKVRVQVREVRDTKWN